MEIEAIGRNIFTSVITHGDRDELKKGRCLACHDGWASRWLCILGVRRHVSIQSSSSRVVLVDGRKAASALCSI